MSHRLQAVPPCNRGPPEGRTTSARRLELCGSADILYLTWIRTMSYWSSLDQAVRAAIDSERVGEPVFVRLTAATAEPAESLEALLGQAVELVETWLSASTSRVYGLGGSDAGALSATLEFPSGATAIVGVAPANGRPSIDLALFGNRGGVYHREDLVPARDGSLSVGLSPRAESVMAAIRRSLSEGKPIDIEEDAT